MSQTQAVVTVHADQSESWFRYANPLQPARVVLTNRELLWQLARRDVVGRYRGSYLGVLWALLTPLLTLAVFTLVFGTIFQHRWANDPEGGVMRFAINMFVGITVFSVFSEVTTGASNHVTGNPNFVKKAVFPLELLGISSVVGSVIHALLALVILGIAVRISLGHIPATAVAVPLLFIPTALFTLGICWFLAALGVFFRDLANAIGPLVQLAFFLTPIVYDRSLLAKFGASGQALTVLNPFVIIVDGARGLLIRGQWPDLLPLGYVTAYSAAVALIGYIFFMRLRRYFADAI
jgi:lipopolysaccharide transport system permease protein